MPHGLHHILCVDDEKDILAIIDLCLTDIPGLRITSVADVQQAIDHLPVLKPDLVLIDLMMPKMNGLDAMRHLRQHRGYEHVPVILMTARAQPQEIRDYISHGVTSVIVKPFDPMKIGEQIFAVWEKIPTRDGL